MHAHSSYDYALIRVVPSVERGECINVGVILFCRTRRFLKTLIDLDIQRLLVVAPDIDLALVQEHLAHFERVCTGGAHSGAIGELSQSERFHWLVSPRSTMIQTSPVHSGLCQDPEAALQRLLNTMVHLKKVSPVS
ncbi:MAG TPA: DUF3037 domain-containing protein [Ktedonobacteraceae bacterium]|nr:DUF3037 domain-containing protein [Ktedonobacteraceae bacterium]